MQADDPQRHLTNSVRRAAQARVVGSDDSLHAVQHSLLQFVGRRVVAAQPGGQPDSWPGCCSGLR